jgi:hypothetical protein
MSKLRVGTFLALISAGREAQGVRVPREHFRAGEVKMEKILRRTVLLAALLSFAGAVAFPQDPVPRKTEVVQNADGTYTVIEYPVGKEVTVSLLPSATITGAKGIAKVIRSADGTKVHVEVNGVPADVKTYHVYAVDPSGSPTYLGPLTFDKGTAMADFSTPLNQFMVVLSPNESLTTVEPTSMVFWSDVPSGYAVVPRRRTSDAKSVATAEPAESVYDVPLLGVPAFNNKTAEVRVNFNGELQGLDGKAYIDSGKGKSQVKMRFGDMKKVPKDKRLILWAASPDGKFTKLGQVVTSGRKDEGEIRGETSLRDFGLLITVEDAEVDRPASRTYGTFTIAPKP